MPFGYVISLDLDDRLAVVVGGGAVATSRVVDLRDAGARVRVVTPSPEPALADLADVDDHVELRVRPWAPGDLHGASIAIATQEDPLDREGFWAESRETGTLASILDDLDHCDFAAPSLVRSGSLRIAVATAGRAPAFAKRLRRHLETTLGDTAGELVDALAEARDRAGPREVDFDTWAARWEDALADLDGLLDQVRAGRTEEVVDRTVRIVTGRAADPDHAAEVAR